MPNVLHRELSPGDELGRDLPPDCCGDEMTGKPDADHIKYTCGDCGTVLEVDGFGLVFDIRD